MISYIKGLLAEKTEDSVVVETQGIGYQIFVPVSALSKLPAAGETVKIYTFLNVREDALNLYGFLSRQDLNMFRQLIGVTGVGPKSALGILSVLEPDALRIAVLSSDAKAIARAPGIGVKTAQRIILDLKDKVKAEDILSPFGDSLKAVPADSGASSGPEKEAVEALVALGYSSGEAAGAVKKVSVTENMTVEEVLKKALRHLSFL